MWWSHKSGTRLWLRTIWSEEWVSVVLLIHLHLRRTNSDICFMQGTAYSHACFHMCLLNCFCARWCAIFDTWKISPTCSFAKFSNSNISDLPCAYGQRPPWWRTCHLAAILLAGDHQSNLCPEISWGCEVQWLADLWRGGSLLASPLDLATALASTRASLPASCWMATFLPRLQEGVQLGFHPTGQAFVYEIVVYVSIKRCWQCSFNKVESHDLGGVTWYRMRSAKIGCCDLFQAKWGWQFSSRERDRTIVVMRSILLPRISGVVQVWTHFILYLTYLTMRLTYFKSPHSNFICFR